MQRGRKHSHQSSDHHDHRKQKGKWKGRSQHSSGDISMVPSNPDASSLPNSDPSYRRIPPGHRHRYIHSNHPNIPHSHTSHPRSPSPPSPTPTPPSPTPTPPSPTPTPPSPSPSYLHLISEFSSSSLNIPAHNLVIDPSPLAKGADGAVYRADYLGTPVAVKKLFYPDEKLQQELEKWCQFRHPNVLLLIGISRRDDAPPFIVMELMDRSLHHLLRDHAVELDWRCRMQIARGIAAGLVYLHLSRQIIHRDIKSLNVLVKGAGAEVKIADFGTSRGSASLVSKQAGTHRWLAPELYDNHPPSFAVDIYALGITFNEILTRQIPFVELGENDAAIMKAVMFNQRPKMDIFPSTFDSTSSPSSSSSSSSTSSSTDSVSTVFDPTPFVKLIQQCWHQDPKMRPSIDVVLESIKAIIQPTSSSASSTLPSSSSDMSLFTYGTYDSTAYSYGASEFPTIMPTSHS